MADQWQSAFFAPHNIAANLFWGAIVTAVIRAYRWIDKRPTDVKREIIFWVVGVLFFAFVARIVGEGIKSFNQPRAEPSAIRGSVYKLSISPTSEGFVAAFNLRLTNPGKASTAWAWVLKLTLAGGQQYEFNAFDFTTASVPGGKVDLLMNDNKTVEFTITADTYLPTMLLRDTVSPERGAHGWVLFYVHGIPRSQVKDGTKFVVEFEQSDGSKRTIEYLWRNPAGWP